MKMRDFFERFDAFFSVYSSIELDVEFNPSIQKFEITDEVYHYASAWWKDLEIVYFCFDSDGILYITAKECE